MARISFLCINLLMVLFLTQPVLQAREKTFTVVIDAGHGGKDPGARGTVINEKEINLSVALKLGDKISASHDDVKVIYTRKTDRFIELDERANIANRNKADLFISIHTNSVKKGSTARGTETYTLGLARTDENLAVAMRENSAILLEDNYEQKYEGFDPNSSESYIIFEFMQNKHMEQSIGFASEIQKCFVSAKRADRGVRQAGFLVLRKTSMPSVLVELGYISNRDEEHFMKSSDGQIKLANALFDAFTRYKKEYDRKQGGVSGGNSSSGSVTTSVETSYFADEQVEEGVAPGSEQDILNRKKKSSVSSQKRQSTTTAARTKSVTTGKIVYKVQILTSDKKLSSGAKVFKGYKNVDYFVEKGIYKYTCGETTDFDSIRKLRRQVAKDFKDAFIVAFKDGKKVKY
ncbi:N-acetylmuramoyl-L-alanine amidase [Parabacteroides faecis]|uniref:N-acetylmuramoyl-L-alanine amidase family protein n=1 Tax=Parabacteroides TaxID=375288 RepID=UPI000EFF77A2|nr:MULTISPECIES: N-acetylmuramoyl-L-alanine amidase [Parabacteroides]MBC8618567.1 N-acetylmuramoyl-L-alanine amidase [Parabacteroides faecis]RHR97907.1 N-acetylmuramoyl-L-alanine amidase [Parabacteroides sp. AF14-59]